jgi:hypothetical protein
MKHIKNIIYSLSVFLSAIGIFSCSGLDPMDEYETFLKGGEIIYSGKVDSVRVYPGKDRIQLSMLLMSDPKINKIKIYWGNHTDSAEFEVTRTSGVDSLNLVLNDMKGGVYNFEIYTMDEDDNISVPVYASGEVYGSRYETNLLHTPLLEPRWYGYADSALVEWGNRDMTAVGDVIKYTNKAGATQTMIVPTDTELSELEDYKPGTTIQYQTMYMPKPTAIDTFYTALKTVALDTAYLLFLVELDVLKNNGDTIEYADWDGERWGIPKDWITNPQVQNMGEWGGFDGYDGGGYVAVEKWNDDHDEVENGKIYQTVTLPAGDYRFEVDFNSRNIKDDGFLVISEGTTLPDVAEVENAIAYEDMADVEEVDFSLTQETEVSIGFLINFFENKSNFRAHNIKLYELKWR